MMVRLVMGREGQTTFGYCCYCCHHHRHHHHHHSRRHTASIVLIAIIGLIYIPAPGKSMWGITNMTRRTESEFSGFPPEHKMMITMTTRSGSETYEGEFVNGLRHGKVIDHFLSSTQTPHTFHIMENFFGKQLLRKPLRDGGF